MYKDIPYVYCRHPSLACCCVSFGDIDWYCYGKFLPQLKQLDGWLLWGDCEVWLQSISRWYQPSPVNDALDHRWIVKCSFPSRSFSSITSWLLCIQRSCVGSNCIPPPAYLFCTTWSRRRALVLWFNAEQEPPATLAVFLLMDTGVVLGCCRCDGHGFGGSYIIDSNEEMWKEDDVGQEKRSSFNGRKRKERTVPTRQPHVLPLRTVFLGLY